jgi:hypothetical protein
MRDRFIFFSFLGIICLLICSLVLDILDVVPLYCYFWLGGRPVSYSFFSEMALIPFLFLLGVAVRKYSARYAVVCFVLGFLVVPMYWAEVFVFGI